MRVWLPIRGVLLLCLCATHSNTAVFVQQQTDALVRTRTSLGIVISSPRGDDFESGNDQDNPA